MLQEFNLFPPDFHGKHSDVMGCVLGLGKLQPAGAEMKKGQMLTVVLKR